MTSHAAKQEIKERRKVTDRRIKKPKHELPFYYTRCIPDRRLNNIQTEWIDEPVIG